MNRERNKKIFTVLIIVIVALGLLGPGVLLFLSPSRPPSSHVPVSFDDSATNEAYLGDYVATSSQESL